MRVEVLYNVSTGQYRVIVAPEPTDDDVLLMAVIAGYGLANSYEDLACAERAAQWWQMALVDSNRIRFIYH
jgi:hypothetical protein